MMYVDKAAAVFPIAAFEIEITNHALAAIVSDTSLPSAWIALVSIYLYVFYRAFVQSQGATRFIRVVRDWVDSPVTSR